MGLRATLHVLKEINVHLVGTCWLHHQGISLSYSEDGHNRILQNDIYLPKPHGVRSLNIIILICITLRTSSPFFLLPGIET
jgi:hypothetical protein